MLNTEQLSRKDTKPYGVYRSRKLTIKHLVLIIMAFKTTIQRELDSFYRSVSNEEFNIRAVTKGAFSRALAKLKPEAFKHLAQVGLNVFYQDAPIHIWAGFRLLAVDSSRLLLPRHPTVVEEFGSCEFGPNADVSQSMAISYVSFQFGTGIFTSQWSACLYGYLPARARTNGTGLH